MADHGSVTVWLDRLKGGDRGDAVARLWGVYFGRLVGLVRDRLRTRPRAVADEEDLALSAFDSFVRAAQAGRFPRLDDRDDLWDVLFMLTSRKVINQIEKETTQKAGGGRVVHLSALQLGNDGKGLDVDLPSGEPDPAEVVAMAEGLDLMLEVLGAEGLRRVVLWRMEGHSNEEIAARLGRSVKTVERKLQTIRTIYRDTGLMAAPEAVGGR